jgi:lactate dehydrogenase-like 2-hydroxyacid dehydrogenase
MVTHSPAAKASSVADLAMALLLSVSRWAAAFEAEVSYYNRSQKPDVLYLFHELLHSLADSADVLMVGLTGPGNR